MTESEAKMVEENLILKFTVHNKAYWIMPEERSCGNRRYEGYIDGVYVVTEPTRHEVCRSLLTLAS